MEFNRQLLKEKQGIKIAPLAETTRRAAGETILLAKSAAGKETSPNRADLNDLWLEPIPMMLRQLAWEAFEEGNAVGFLCRAPNEYAILLVAKNIIRLLERGIYEKTLLEAITATSTNNRHIRLDYFKRLFAYANPERLRAAGDPLPGGGPFTLYRGVAGTGRSRRVRGISWTADFERAVWFAKWHPLPDPGVYQAVVPAKYVLARAHEGFRNEDEYLVLLPKHIKVERLTSPPAVAPMSMCG